MAWSWCLVTVKSDSVQGGEVVVALDTVANSLLTLAQSSSMREGRGVG